MITHKELDKCYLIQVFNRDWHEAYDLCQDIHNSNLVRINSEIEQREITRLISEKKSDWVPSGQGTPADWRDVWIGLSDFFTPGTLTWSTHQDQPSYTNWAYGEPNEDMMSNNVGGTCTFIPADIDASDKWQTYNCGKRDKSYMCELESGKSCPLGWTYFKTDQDTESCLLLVLNGREYVPWWSARQRCAAIGAELFVPDSKSENDALVKYFEEWNRAGVTQMWLGVSANENCDFRKSNGYPLNYEGWSTDEPNCESDTDPQCVVLNTLASENNWKVGNCYSNEAYACQLAVGQKPHQEPIDTPDYYCQQSPDYTEAPFKLYNDDIVGPTCIQFLKNSGNVQGATASWDDSQKRCKEQGANLVSIHSAQQNSWIRSNMHVSKIFQLALSLNYDLGRRILDWNGAVKRTEAKTMG